MKKLSLFLAVVLAVISCKKDDPQTLPASPGRLIKVVSKSGNDSIVKEYNYDASGRLVFETRKEVKSGMTENQSIRIVRDNAGMITRTTEIADYLIAAGIDSIVTQFNQSGGRYISSLAVINQGGIIIRDSVVYSYDVNGRIIRDQHYQAMTGAPFQQLFRQDYSYTAAGNIDSIKNYTFSGGVYDISFTGDYDYDNSVNPLQLQNDAIILYHFELFGGNNTVKIKSDHINPSYNSLATLSYTYRPDGRPSTSITNSSPPASVWNDTYYYQ